MRGFEQRFEAGSKSKELSMVSVWQQRASMWRWAAAGGGAGGGTPVIRTVVSLHTPALLLLHTPPSTLLLLWHLFVMRLWSGESHEREGRWVEGRGGSKTIWCSARALKGRGDDWDAEADPHRAWVRFRGELQSGWLVNWKEFKEKVSCPAKEVKLLNSSWHFADGNVSLIITNNNKLTVPCMICIDISYQQPSPNI